MKPLLAFLLLLCITGCGEKPDPKITFKHFHESKPSYEVFIMGGAVYVMDTTAGKIIVSLRPNKPVNLEDFDIQSEYMR